MIQNEYYKNIIFQGVDVGYETIQNYINTIKQNTQPSLIVEIEELDIKEQPIKPIAYKNRYYKRYRNSNHLMSLDEISNEHLKTINASWDYYVDDRHNFSDISQENIIKAIEKIENYQGKKFNNDPMTILKKFELIKEDKLTFGVYLLFTCNNSALTAFTIDRDSGHSIIKIFDDKIEFFNPGKLYDDITIEKLNSNNYSSKTRNRAIARFFKEAGIIERYGSGINRIKAECKAHGVIEPLFEEFVHGFRVTLFKEKLSDQATEQAILDFCREAKTTNEIMQFINLTHREHFRSAILKPLLDKKLLTLTIPDKPKSPKQKYITTQER